MKLYRFLAVVLLLLGILVIGKAVKDTIGDMTSQRSGYVIKCDEKRCMPLMPDGTVLDWTIERPKGTRR